MVGLRLNTCTRNTGRTLSGRIAAGRETARRILPMLTGSASALMGVAGESVAAGAGGAAGASVCWAAAALAQPSSTANPRTVILGNPIGTY